MLLMNQVTDVTIRTADVIDVYTTDKKSQKTLFESKLVVARAPGAPPKAVKNVCVEVKFVDGEDVKNLRERILAIHGYVN